jgi:predicted enzyme related to lactoylglutathione lyase
MFKNAPAFSSFSVNDLARAKDFYGEALGLEVEEDTAMAVLRLHLADGGKVMIYPKDNHEPATYTVLNFVVKDIDKAVDAISAKGVPFEHYDQGMLKTDEKGIARGKKSGMGPDIAWFRDPAGNIIGVFEDQA